MIKLEVNKGANIFKRILKISVDATFSILTHECI